MSKTNGAYMISTKVPMQGDCISMPSVNNWSSYMDQFVSGGRLLSGELEVTQKALNDIITNSVSKGSNTLEGMQSAVEFKIIELRGE